MFLKILGGLTHDKYCTVETDIWIGTVLIHEKSWWVIDIPV